MGLGASSLSREEIVDLLKVSHFSQREILRLWKRFCQLDKKGEGYLTKECFEGIPELSMNPLESRIFHVFDYERTGRISFRQFVRTLSAFDKHASAKEKLDILFRIYDRDGKGISKQETLEVVSVMVGNHIPQEQINRVVEQSFAGCSLNAGGNIDFEEFQNILAKSDAVRKMQITFS